MDLLAPVARNVIAPIWAAWEGSSYLQHHRRLLRTQYQGPESWLAHQSAALRELAHHACQTVPFWAERFRQAELHPAELSHPANVSRLPLLTKGDLREEGVRLISLEYRMEDLHRHSTSGSIGIPTVTYRDDACQQIKRAAALRSNEWSGWRLGERVASVWGNPDLRRDWRGRLRNALLKRAYLHLDTLRMDKTSMVAFVDGLRRKPTSLLFGHAHSLYLLASFILAERPTTQIRPKGIVATAMVLHDFERDKIEQVFQCPVTNRYGAEEVSLVACECDQHRGLHVNADCLYVEVVDQCGQPCPPGKPGRVIVTDLTNRAMPLFRYDIGDVATWAALPCPCGRTLPLLERIEGRVADYVVTRHGEYISGISLTENFAVQVPGVAQMQIIQEDFDLFTYRIVRDPSFGAESLQRIADLTACRFGQDAKYECRYVHEIAPEPSGKYRFCISKLATSTKAPGTNS